MTYYSILNRIITIGLFLLIYTHSLFAQNNDIGLLRKINIDRNKKWDATFYTVSNSVAPVLILSPASLFLYGEIHHDKQLKQQALLQVAGIVFTGGTTWLMKQSVQRPRPYITYPDILPYNFEQSYSFPSAHTSFSFYTATIHTLEYKKWYIAVPFYTWASAVAYSRMHLGVHYPSDVLVGAALGAGSAWLTHSANKWMKKKRKKHGLIQS